LRVRIGNLLPNAAVFVSSVEEGRLAPLRRSLLAAAREGTQISEIRISTSDGKLLAQIHREAEVIEQRTENGQLVVKARLANDVSARLRRAGATVR
jgi:GTP-binding protein HflX